MTAVPSPLPDRLPSAELASVKRDKLTGYLLNLRHEQGRPKAVWFRDRLGFSLHHHEELRIALREAAKTGRVTGCRPNQHGGLNWSVVVTVVGRNGATCDLLTVWSTRFPGAAPTFVTAYPD